MKCARCGEVDPMTLVRCTFGHWKGKLLCTDCMNAVRAAARETLVAVRRLA